MQVKGNPDMVRDWERDLRKFESSWVDWSWKSTRSSEL
ncbi:hypothetical protein HG1285_00530 [Hydrogenivirga sp. 128-5-R1-1]|nr:hypothetical protein HG1285_00530 [Hydrogenivirga sp. 128-5-R1-1]